MTDDVTLLKQKHSLLCDYVLDSECQSTNLLGLAACATMHYERTLCSQYSSLLKLLWNLFTACILMPLAFTNTYIFFSLFLPFLPEANEVINPKAQLQHRIVLCYSGCHVIAQNVFIFWCFDYFQMKYKF